MLAYLVFRFIDTIEDSKASKDQKKYFFVEFINILNANSFNMESAADYQRKFIAAIDFTYEKPLIDNFVAMVKLYFNTPRPDRKSLLKYATLMAEGMYRFLSTPIETFSDQNEYCYYVAGVVAQFFNELFFNNGRLSHEDCVELMPLARDYGLALQKVNLLMDIAHDIFQNRKYWPTRILEKHGFRQYESLIEGEKLQKAMAVLHEMTEDAFYFLKRGLQYVKRMGKKQLKIRVFCLLPLFTALEHLRGSAGNPNVFIKGKKFKLAKPHILTILLKSYLFGSINMYLSYWFGRISKHIECRP